MSLPLVYALLAWQQPTPAPTAPSVPQPIARVDVKPAEYALQVGDTVRLHAVAYDSSGRAMPEAVIRWFASGGRFEGSVDSTGLVSAGSTGTLNVAAVAGLAGRAVKSTVAFAHITVLAQPAATIVVTPRPERMLVGTSLVLAGVPYAPNGDRRYDHVTWKSSRPGVVDVTPIGRLTARAAGRAAVTALAGKTSTSWTVVVTPSPVARVTLTPTDTAIRSGDVVRFVFLATDAARRTGRERRHDDRGRQIRCPDARGCVDAQERHRDSLVRGPRTPQGDRRVHRDGHRRRPQYLRLQGLCLPDRRRDRLHARHRHPRPIPPQASGTLAGGAPRGRADAARHRRAGRAGDAVLLERRPGDTRRGDRPEGWQRGDS